MAHFSLSSLDFLMQLAANNNKPWFEEHKSEFIEHVRDPFRRLLADLDPQLAGLSPHYRVDMRGNGGSLFRIYRDARFSKDKSPYKPWAGARVWHEKAGKSDGPLFYMHFQPDNMFLGAGIWHPAAEPLRKIRHFLHHNPNTWIDVIERLEAEGRWQLEGESLKRMPRGSEADDPVAQHLKRKDFISVTRVTDEWMLSDDLADRIVTRFEEVAPVMDYLCAALDLEW